ncbi:DUF3976 domain-containing protein [Lentibacillus salinarum]|uniref:DUF3976 domain-containing protein n=1 Tax=Lentibacillus salinarum TaxID=446820 RepID=A0ABW3ZY10_9BACI
MQQWYFIIGFFVIWFLMYLWIRKDVDENKRMSKKGFIKMISFIVVMIAMSGFLGFVAGR